MRRGADAAPSRSPNAGLTTLVLAGLCLLGLATSQAVAQGFPQQTPIAPMTTTVATAPAPPPPPAPDPRPTPKPDPKPARPRQAVPPKAPPPPPPPLERAARQPITTTALAPTAPSRLARVIGVRYHRGGRQRQRRFGHLVNHAARRQYELVAIVLRSGGGSRWFRTGAHRLLRWNQRSTSPLHRRQFSRNRRAPPSPRFPRFSF